MDQINNIIADHENLNKPRALIVHKDAPKLIYKHGLSMPCKIDLDKNRLLNKFFNGQNKPLRDKVKPAICK